MSKGPTKTAVLEMRWMEVCSSQISIHHRTQHTRCVWRVLQSYIPLFEFNVFERTQNKNKKVLKV